MDFSVGFSGPNGSAALWCALTAQAGETISVAFTGWSDALLAIYDEAWNLIDTVSVSSSPATSAALPATGCYRIGVLLSTPPPTTPPDSGTASITSSGALAIGGIRALYDDGGTPAALVCA